MLIQKTIKIIDGKVKIDYNDIYTLEEYYNLLHLDKRYDNISERIKK
jgi:hypothetical protein